MNLIEREGLKSILNNNNVFLKDFIEKNRKKILDGWQVHEFEKVIEKNNEIIRLLGD